MTTTTLIILFMLIAVALTDAKLTNVYRCTRCGASRKDMHSNWCEDRNKA